MTHMLANFAQTSYLSATFVLTADLPFRCALCYNRRFDSSLL